MKTEYESNCLIDTNVLVYAYNNSDAEKNQKAKELIKKCWQGQIVLFLSVQNLSEFYSVMTGKIKTPLSGQEIKDRIEAILNFSGWKVFGITKNTIPLALSMCIDYSVPYWDALIMAVMKEQGIVHIYTENIKDFNKVPGIIPINPFK